MSGFFQFGNLEEEGGERTSTSVFADVGFKKNPFPESGVESPVFYQKHMKAQTTRLDEWLATVGTATCESAESELTRPGSIPPLAVSGALGVGKTHLLKRLKIGLEEDSDYDFRVLRADLTEESSSRLVLSGLLLDFLQNVKADEASSSATIPLLAKMVEDHGPDQLHDSIEGLGDTSVLAAPLRKVIEGPGDERQERVEWLSNWICRSYITQSQMGKLGLNGKIKPHGQSLKAIAELMLLAWYMDEVDCFYVLIDQLEDLFRPNTVTATRRARFLTDLRQFIDYALEGFPIATMLAWNTAVSTGVGRGAQRVETAKNIEDSYHALWQRLGSPVDLPGLRKRDIWDFAETYLDYAKSDPKWSVPGAEDKRREFRNRLNMNRNQVLERLQSASGVELGSGRYTPRAVLTEWRKLARELASQS